MIWIGCCGFAEAQAQYFREFDAVEIQHTFYDPPRPATAERWRRRAGAEFHFAVKAWQAITHEPSSPTYRRMRTPIPAAARGRYGSFRPTPEVSAAWQRMCEVALAMRARIVLFQCPASFRPTEENIDNLRHFFDRVPRHELLFAWEPRGSWPVEQIRALCHRCRLVHAFDPFAHSEFLLHSGAAVTRSASGSAARGAKTKQAVRDGGGLRYFRLHGIGGAGYRYSDDDLARLTAWAVPGPGYVFFNNLSMLDDARRFRACVAGNL